MKYIKPVVKSTKKQIKNVEIFVLPQGYLHIVIPSSYGSSLSVRVN